MDENERWDINLKEFHMKKKITITIHDIAFELFAMHCGIGIGKRQKKIPQEKWMLLFVSPVSVSDET